MSDELRLGDLQLRIMQALWDGGRGTVADVHVRLADENPQDAALAYTTVATMLRKMEDRGLVAHTAEGRKFIYEAAVEELAVTRSMTHDLLDRLFEGSLADMVHHLLSSREISRNELEELEQLISKRKRLRKRS